MIEYRDYVEYFNRLNITEENGMLLLNFLEALALIGIEYQENNELKKELIQYVCSHEYGNLCEVEKVYKMIENG